MSSADKYKSDLAKNLTMKLDRYLMSYTRDEYNLKLIVYGDDEPASFRMWKSIFHRKLVDIHYTPDFDLIPIPADYTPQSYEKYEKELREFVANYFADKHLIWGLYNVEAAEQNPRMHLVLANQRVKQSELGRWARTNKSESLGSAGAHQDARFISIESLRGLVSNLLDFKPLSTMQDVSSASSSSSSTSKGERVGQLAHVMPERSGTSASGAGSLAGPSTKSPPDEDKL